MKTYEFQTEFFTQDFKSSRLTPEVTYLLTLGSRYAIAITILVRNTCCSSWSYLEDSGEIFAGTEQHPGH